MKSFLAALMIATAKAGTAAVVLRPHWMVAAMAGASAALVGALLMGRKANEARLTPGQIVCEILLCGVLGWLVQVGLVAWHFNQPQTIVAISAIVGSTGSRGVVMVSAVTSEKFIGALKQRLRGWLDE